MHQQYSPLRLASWLSLAVLITCGGCGGGSKGTGGDQLSGLVLTTGQQPVANVQVTALESGASTRTAADGSFTLDDDFSPGDLRLGIETERFSGTVTVANVPTGRARIRVVIEVDDDREEARLREETVEHETESEFTDEVESSDHSSDD